MSGKTLVLGIGNTLLSDEGVGVHVIRYLGAHPGETPLADVELLDAGTLSFTIAPHLEGVAALVIIDAAQLGENAGAVRVVEGEAMDVFLHRQRRLSVHEVSLVDLLQVLRLTSNLPAHRALVGIQPASIDWGEVTSEPVAQAIPHAAAQVRELIDRWRCKPASMTHGFTSQRRPH